MAKYKRFEAIDDFDKYLTSGDLAMVKDLLGVNLQLDRTMTTGGFEDGVEYVEKVKGVNLHEKFDESLHPLYGARVDAKDKTMTSDDFVESVFYLKKNFCDERIEDTKKLGRYLFPNEMKQPVSATDKHPNQATTHPVERQSVPGQNPPKATVQKTKTSMMPVALLVGGVVAVTIAAILILK